MPTNPFINYFDDNRGEVFLMQDLIEEMIQFHGSDVYYIPREDIDVAAANIFGEKPDSEFLSKYMIEMYLINAGGFEGSGDAMTAAGWTIVDDTVWAVSHRIFHKIIPQSVASRPREGDLLYIPFMHKLMEIKFVEEDASYFAMGRQPDAPYYFELRCRTFKYSHENIQIGLPEVDVDILHDIAHTIELTMNVAQPGNYIINEVVFQGANLAFASGSARVTDWNRNDGLLKLINTSGEFTQNVAVRGVSSNTNRTVVFAHSIIDHPQLYGHSDAPILQQAANTILVTTETNRFGTP